MRRGHNATVVLQWPQGVRAHGEPLLVSGAPRLVARAQAAKLQMNRAPFEAFAVDVPALIAALGMPARAEASGTTEGALAELGTHAELIARGGVYKTLWERQRREKRADGAAAATAPRDG